MVLMTYSQGRQNCLHMSSKVVMFYIVSYHVDMRPYFTIKTAASCDLSALLSCTLMITASTDK